MSSNGSPSPYAHDAFVTDADFKVEINQKMKVPEKISFSQDTNGEVRNSWVKDNFSMQVPERILVMGQDQHVGTRAPPREIAFDNSFIASEPYPSNLPRVATPPRTLTLDRYPFPEYQDQEPEPEDQLPVVVRPNKAKVQLNDSIYSFRDSATPPLGGDCMTSSEEVVHLRRQMAKLNRRMMALELENLNRLQKEKFFFGIGMAYLFLKVIIWMNRV
ncbi:unnamed protein product [Ceutorhynchus assimilis]|uniref:Mff-like domain-containing protein n=1 Tax=Ceutorhynchus assimilis TaxID=467358 RepID=A0A9N9QRK2_9CUCU|nr:unnamed protein product [Ceutorhynchus assimilis]